MADKSERVMALIEKELQADPNTSNEALRAKAEKVDGSIASMSARQFNATYPLQVKRRMQPRRSRKRAKAAKRAGGRKGAKRSTARKAGSAKRGRGRPGSGAKKGVKKRGRPLGSKNATGPRGGTGVRAVQRGDAARGRVRATLLDFARDLASADGAELVDVIAGVDGYVERVLEATGAR